MIGYISLGICGNCGVPRTVRTYEPEAVEPSCNCTSVPPTFASMVEEQYQRLRDICSGEDLSTVLLRMQSIQGAIAKATVDNDQGAILIATIELNALTKLIAENLMLDEEEEDDDDSENPSAP